MEILKDSVLSLVAESKTDSSDRDYVSEGLYMAAVALKNGGKRVISSDILGPTWFPGHGRRFNDTLLVGEDMASEGDYEVALTKGDVLSIDEMQKRIIDPSWRLNEATVDIMCDFTFIKQAPILNLLNGFEYLMDNVFKAAANLVSKKEGDEDPAWLVDAGILLKEEERKGTTVADVAMGRARRVVALFLGYTLIDILKWKYALAKRLMKRGISFESVPHNVQYERLTQLVEERVARFVNGEVEGSVSLKKKKKYAIPTVSNVLANVSASVEQGFYPRISGTFYEAILGYEIMSMFSPLISAEYFSLLSRSKNVYPPQSMRFERYVSDHSLTFSKNITEQERGWIRKERNRKRHPSEVVFASHPFLAKAIGGIFGPYKSKAATDALQREFSREFSPALAASVEDLEAHVVKKRQVNFSNFSVLRVSPSDSAARFSMYALWNSLFLSTGGLTFSVNGSRSRLLTQFVLKDLHALFSCARCEYGYLIKSLDTFSILEREKNFKGGGRQEMMGYLKLALEALDPLKAKEVKDHMAQAGGDSEGKLIAAILAANQESSAEDLGMEGKLRQKEEDTRVLQLYNIDKEAYMLEAGKYVKVSKGFAAMAFYLLYSSTATAPPPATLNPLDRSVFLLLARWGNIRFPTGNLWGAVKEDQKSASLIAFAALWSLRNAVRARRKIGNPLKPGTDFVPDTPGRPLSLLSALANRGTLATLLSNNYVDARNVDSENLLWRGLSELQGEAEIWTSGSSESVKRARSMLGGGSSSHMAKMVIEPSGTIPTTKYVRELFPITHMQQQQLQSGGGVTTQPSTPAPHPLSMVGKIALSVDDMKSFTKETYARLPYFPITPFDF